MWHIPTELSSAQSQSESQRRDRRHFWKYRAHVGSGPAPGPTKKRPCATHARWVGQTSPAFRDDFVLIFDNEFDPNKFPFLDVLINTINNTFTIFLYKSLCSRKNFVCLARKFVSSYIFTEWGWRILFSPDDFPGQIEFGESPPNFLFFSISRAGRMCFYPRSYSSSCITPWGEPSNLWTLESTLLDPRVPSWIWIKRINFASDNSATSWTTFKKTMITSLPQQTGPRIYGWIFIPVLKSATQYLLWL